MDPEAQYAPAAAVPVPETPESGVPDDSQPETWGYRELAYLVGFGVISLGLSMLVAGAVVAVGRMQFGVDLNPESSPYAVYIVLGVQLLWWVFLFTFMYAVVSIKYGLPFWEGIGFQPLPIPAVWFALAGFLLAPLVAVTGKWIDVPQDTPFEQLLENAHSLWLLGAFGVIVAPLTEEMTFRGFVFPVIERKHGGVAAVVVTSACFALLHAQQYAWAWQIVLLMFFIGGVFGWLRLKTGSVGPSTIMHAAYNGTLFLALFSAKQMGIDKL